MLALRYDGTVWAWGNNDYGQLGISKAKDTSGNLYYESISSPVQVVASVDSENNPTYLKNIVQIAAGENFSAALDRDGNVWTWGHAANGQLGTGDISENQTYPTQVSISDVVYITAGPYNMFVIRKDGSVWSWGFNTWGQLGINKTGDQSIPQRVHGGASGGAYLSDIVKVEAGGYTAYALKANGTVWTWGNNGYSQLGNGMTSGYSYVPVQVKAGQQTTSKSGYLENIIDIDGESSNWRNAGAIGPVTAVSADGIVYFWGYTQSIISERHYPAPEVLYEPEGENDKAIQVVVGGPDYRYNHVYMLTREGKVYSQGHDGYGELGNGAPHRV